MYDEILIPTDGSSGMEQVTEQALGIAEGSGGRVHSLYVVDERAYMSVPDDARDQVNAALESDGYDATRAVAEQVTEAECEAVQEVRWGDPAVVIITYAMENDIDLIVMGTRGKTGFERYLLGSVAEKVVRLSPIPVLTVHIGDQKALTEEIEQLIGLDR
ncbi:universal stress protein [Haloarcula amylovorans]|uniref:universal stress protein n=1 Tax=Haloarcula amylovorans TaxID=2562280 RepID=UPI0010768A6F|nr:universal stress protein [Halomicroarcula amylolytica]